jgi:hypothetical protein
MEEIEKFMVDLVKEYGRKGVGAVMHEHLVHFVKACNTEHFEVEGKGYITIVKKIGHNCDKE